MVEATHLFRKLLPEDSRKYKRSNRLIASNREFDFRRCIFALGRGILAFLLVQVLVVADAIANELGAVAGLVEKISVFTDWVRWFVEIE